jgi:hypothetical protein
MSRPDARAIPVDPPRSSHISSMPGTMMVALLCLLLALAPARAQSPSAAAPVPEAWFGTWIMNIEKSRYTGGNAPYRRASYTIAPWQDGLKVTYDMVYPRGGWTRLEWSGRLDGNDYRVQGLDEVVTYAYRLLPDGSCEVAVKFDGRATATSRITLSADGRTMTTTTAGRGAQGQPVGTITVYEKQ